MPDINASFLGTIPELYDRHLGAVIFAPYAADLARRVTLPVAGSVLELACGTGILTQQLRAHLPPAVPLFATDLNQPMIDYARARLGALAGIDWQQADAAALPFSAASFGALVCQFGLMFVPDKAAAVREARRVLVPGGQFAFSVWGSFADNPYGRIAHDTIVGFFPTDPPDFYQVPFGFHDAAMWQDLLADNDFGGVQAEWVTLPLYSASANAFAVGLVKGNPVSLAIAARGVELDKVVAAVEAALVKVGGDQPFRSSMRALVVTARAGTD